MKLLTVSPAIYFAACGALGLLAAGIILIAVRPQPVVKPGPLQKNLSSARAAD
jgi:hypothetical protein